MFDSLLTLVELFGLLETPSRRIDSFGILGLKDLLKDVQSLCVRNAQVWELKKGPFCTPTDVRCLSVFPFHFLWWGVTKGSSIPWVMKFKGVKNPGWKLSNGWSRRYRENKSASRCRKMSGREVTGWQISSPAFPDMRFLQEKGLGEAWHCGSHWRGGEAELPTNPQSANARFWGIRTCGLQGKFKTMEENWKGCFSYSQLRSLLMVSLFYLPWWNRK